MVCRAENLALCHLLGFECGASPQCCHGPSYFEENPENIWSTHALSLRSFSPSVLTFVGVCFARDVTATSIICERLNESISP